MSRFKPKLGDKYITYSNTDNDTQWVMQVLSAVSFNDDRFYICHKLGYDEVTPDTDQLYLFNDAGKEVRDFVVMDFYWVRKTSRKHGFTILKDDS